jgi:hypothetical protein
MDVLLLKVLDDRSVTVSEEFSVCRSQGMQVVPKGNLY